MRCAAARHQPARPSLGAKHSPHRCASFTWCSAAWTPWKTTWLSKRWLHRPTCEPFRAAPARCAHTQRSLPFAGGQDSAAAGLSHQADGEELQPGAVSVVSPRPRLTFSILIGGGAQDCGTGHYNRLMKEFPHVIAAFLSLKPMYKARACAGLQCRALLSRSMTASSQSTSPPPAQEAITDVTKRMGQGMADFISKQARCCLCTPLRYACAELGKCRRW